MNGAGFPHSEIFGSKRACRSPKLIAACCVLRRLMKPRHPSIAVTGFMQTLNILGVYLTHLHYLSTLKTFKERNCDSVIVLSDVLRKFGPRWI